MAITDEDVLQIRGMIREEIERAFAAVFLATRVEDFGGMMTPEIEKSVREALANIECNSEKV
jgi:hypothetical protein